MKSLACMCGIAALASCSPDEQDQLRGLVGEGNLDRAQIGPSEEIEVRLARSHQSFSRHLEFRLTPDGTLTVRRFRVALGDPRDLGGVPVPEVERTDQMRLSPAATAEFRKSLAVFRPDTLGPEAPFLMPKGCNFTFHGQSRVVIGFSAPSDHSGLFIRQGECDHENAERLDEALRAMLASLPRTEAAAGFAW